MRTYRFGPLLRTMRMRLCIGQGAMAEMLGTTASRLSKIERGKILGPGPEFVERLCEPLHATPAESFFLARVAARDRLLSHVAKLGFSEPELDYLSTALDAAILLPPDVLAMLARNTRQQVNSRAQLLMLDRRPTFAPESGPG